MNTDDRHGDGEDEDEAARRARAWEMFRQSQELARPTPGSVLARSNRVGATAARTMMWASAVQVLLLLFVLVVVVVFVVLALVL